MKSHHVKSARDFVEVLFICYLLVLC